MDQHKLGTHHAGGMCLVPVEPVEKLLGLGDDQFSYQLESILHSILGVAIEDVDATFPVQQDL